MTSIYTLPPLERPRITFIHITFLFHISSFLLTLWGFWTLQTILWNRIVYSNGDWANSLPIYLRTSLSLIKTMLFSDTVLFSVGILFLLIISIIVLNIYRKNPTWNKNLRLLFIFQSIITFLISFMSFWILQSLNIIAGLPAVGEGQTGEEWLYIDIPEFTNILSPLSLIIQIIFSAIFVLSLFVLIMNREQEEEFGKEKSKVNLFISKSIRNKINFMINYGKSPLRSLFIFVNWAPRTSLKVLKGTPRAILNSMKHFPRSSWNFIKNLPHRVHNFLLNTPPSVLNFVKSLPLYAVIGGYLLLTLLPVIMTIIVSVSSSADLRNHILPSHPLEALIKNFSSVLFAISINEPAFSTAFIYSIILGLGTGLLGLAVSLSAGYALARFKFAGNKLLTFMILATQMFPGLILLIPQYVIWKDLGLLEDQLLLFGVLLAYISGAVAYTTWMMKGYFETIPVDLEEAALIDGAGRLGTFFRIAIPLAKPGMVAVLIFTYLTAWSEFVLARTFIGETDPQATLPLLFYNYQNPAAPDNPIFFELLAPYAILVALPPVLLFLFLQKELAAGAVAGGIK